MRVQIDLTLDGDPERSVHALMDVDPSLRLRDLDAVIGDAIRYALYEHAKPGDVLLNALKPDGG